MHPKKLLLKTVELNVVKIDVQLCISNVVIALYFQANMNIYLLYIDT